MIKTFANDETHDLFMHGDDPAKGCGWAQVAEEAERKLDMVEEAEEVQDLWRPPGNNFKRLDGDWCSIRINDQWRIIWEWREDGKYNVEITDYHDD